METIIMGYVGFGVRSLGFRVCGLQFGLGV